MVAAALVKHHVQKRSADERLVEARAAVAVPEKTGAGGVAGEGGGKDRPDSE